MSDDRAPLRIAIVYDCLYPYTAGGGERVYTEMAARLARRGHEVHYLTRVQWAGTTPAAPFTIEPIWRGEIADAAGQRRMAAAVKFALAVFRSLRRARGRYDIVIVSALPPLNVFAARAAVRRSTWLVADWLEVWPLRKWREYSGAVVGGIAWMLQSWGLRRSDEVTVNSAFTLARARARLKPRTGLVLGLVDLVGEQGTPPEAQPEVRPGMILFAGRHIADKQLPTLPAALAVVRRTHPNARLVVVGSGPETPRLLEAATALGVDIDVRGRVPNDELDALMAQAAVLVNPSRREGFGLVVAEAAAQGTPSVVVAGEDNAAAELIENGVNGYVAGSTDPEALGGALVSALNGGESLRESTRAWFATARATRNLDATLDELLRRYDAFRAR